MRRLVFPVLLLLLSLVTYSATRLVAGRLRAATVGRVEDPEEGAIGKESKETDTPAIDGRVRHHPRDNPHIKYAGSMGSARIAIEGRTIHASAVAYIYHINPEMRFVWALRLTDPKDPNKVAFEKFYDDQIFTLPDTKELAPNFEDTIALDGVAAGKYMAQVGVYQIYPQSKPEDFKDPKRLRNHEGPRYREVIEIKD